MSDTALYELYDRDFFEWTQQSAAALRAAAIPGVDIEHVAEEIESMGKRDLHAVNSRIVRILEHKLKLTYTRGIVLDQNRPKWRKTVDDRQLALELLLRDSPSLRARVPELIPDNYAYARRKFERDYQIASPVSCPWDVRAILEEN